MWLGNIAIAAMLIIALKSATGFLGYLGQVEMAWVLVLH